MGSLLARRPLALVLVLLVAGCSLALDDLSNGTVAGGSDAATALDGSGDGSGGGDSSAADADGKAGDDGGVVSTAFVQVMGLSMNSGAGTATLKGVGAHNAIVCAFTHDSTGTVAVSDGTSATYATLVGPTPNTGSHSSILAALDVAGGDTTLSVSIPGGTTPSYMVVYIMEYAGLLGFDVGAANNGGGTVADGMNATVTTTHANDLLVGYGFSGRVAVGTGFTARSTYSNNLIEDRLLGDPGSYRATATMTNGQGWQMLAASFTR